MSDFHPLISEWFERKFAAPTEPQIRGWPEIRSGRDVLISAPTGSGKTLAAFLLCLDGLVGKAARGELAERLEALYVSPLKALSNDVKKNLELPLEEISTLAEERGQPLTPIHAAVRTGDTLAWERRAMLRRPPHDVIIEMLSEGIATKRGRGRAYLHRDRVHGRIRGRRGARLAAITSGGAIPDNANYLVVAEPEGKTVGTVDEDFAVESMAGDIFLLGTTSWRIRRVESGRVRVEDAQGAAPNIPFWLGEAPGRTVELSMEVSRIRKEIASRAEESPEKAVSFLIDDCCLERGGAEQAVEYVTVGRNALGALPSHDTIVAERFFDEAGGMQLVLQSPLGTRINRAWGLALRKRFCRTFNFELQAAAVDNGIVISLAEQHAFPLEAVFGFLNPLTVEEVLKQALLPTPMFTARWRWNASRALAVLRFAGGRKVPPPLQRMRGDDLIAAVFPDQAACAENLVGDIRNPSPGRWFAMPTSYTMPC